MQKVRWIHVVTVLLAIWLGSPAYAQVTTATIFGTVRDEGGGVMPGVSVTALHVETGAERNAISDDAGRYRLSGLELGMYQVRAELSGFRRELRSGIVLTLGREAAVDFALNVGEITEQVTVTGEASLVDTSSATLGGLVSEDRIKDLPLNGRSFQQLALLQPGVIMATKSTGSLLFQGKGTRLSASGAKPSFNVFLLDGVEMNDATDNSGASAAGQMLGVEGIREFRVLTSNISAEYGRGAGALVSAVTKSGTNTFHGSVYEFHRNSALDARNFFDRNKPSFRRHQFGFEVDGPLRKDVTFFMVNYEGLREGLGRTLVNFVPDADARRGSLPGRQPFPVHSSVAPFLAVYPLPNGLLLGNGTGIYTFSNTDTSNANFFMVKGDHRFSNSDSLAVRYRLDDADVVSTADSIFDGLAVTRSYNALIEEKRIFTSNLLNIARVGFNRPITQEDGKPRINLNPSLMPIPGSGLFWGQIAVAGLSTTGQAELQQVLHNAYQLSDDLLYNWGNHSLKAGALFRFVKYRRDTRVRVGGRWEFPSLFDFLTNQPSLLETVRPPFDTVRNVRQNLYGFYFQDDLRIAPRFTLNLGIRYETVTVPYEVEGKMNNLRGLTDPAVTAGKPLYQPTRLNFAPRVGFAWDLFGDSRTALRGGFGMFHNQITTRMWDINFSNAVGFRTQIQLTSPPFPVTSLDQLQRGTEGAIRLNIFQYEHVKTPYVMQWNLTLERELVPNTVAMVAYVGSRGVNLGLNSDPNIPVSPQIVDGRKFFAAGLPKLNPRFGPMTLTATVGDSFYHSVRLSLTRRLAEGLQFQASYTHSKAIDDFKDVKALGFGGSPNSVQDPFDRRGDRGLSEIDVRNNFVANWSYALPFSKAARPWVNQLAAGWRLNGIVTLADGAPFSVRVPFDRARTGSFGGLRPDLRPGASNNPIVGRPDRYFDLSAFALQPLGFYGNLGRNTLVGPGLANMDFSIAKDFDVRERVAIQFRTEVFNILNHSNFDAPGDSTSPVGVFDRLGQPQPSTARLIQTTTTSRQVQFGLKIVF
ncbi:MAG: TonB-dependent receptor [Acidobacteria bacterium]|nr:TonB-dependent receptor [Acidobacteriota bacterium]